MLIKYYSQYSFIGERSRVIAHRIITFVVLKVAKVIPVCNCVSKLPTVSEKRSVFRRETAATIYKSQNGLVPGYLSSYFATNSTRKVRILRNTETDLSLTVPKANNGQKGISFRGPKLWNYLENDVKQVSSLATIKKRMKTLQLRKQLFCCLVLLSYYVFPRPPEKPFSWTDGLSCLNKIE